MADAEAGVGAELNFQINIGVMLAVNRQTDTRPGWRAEDEQLKLTKEETERFQ